MIPEPYELKSFLFVQRMHGRDAQILFINEIFNHNGTFKKAVHAKNGFNNTYRYNAAYLMYPLKITFKKH